MSGGVAVLLAAIGLILIVVAVRGTYADVLTVLATGGKVGGSEPNTSNATAGQEAGPLIPKEPNPSLARE